MTRNMPVPGLVPARAGRAAAGAGDVRGQRETYSSNVGTAAVRAASAIVAGLAPTV